MKQSPILYLIFLFFVSCGTPHYLVSDFETRTADHKKVAVIPFEMILTGKTPKGLSEEDILKIEEAESKAFQSAFFRHVSRSSDSRKKALRIDLQPTIETQNRLEKAGISIRESWTMDASELAVLLEVDAVAGAKIKKTRYISDLESLGIELGIEAINAITRYFFAEVMPYGLTKSKDVIADFALFDKADGAVLWSISFEMEADWSSSSNDIIRTISRKAARTFPYRMERKK